MQTIVNTAEAAANLSALIEQSRLSPVIIRENGEDVAFLFSLRSAEKNWSERNAAWRKFEATRGIVISELEAKLATEGRTVEEFLADVLED